MSAQPPSVEENTKKETETNEKQENKEEPQPQQQQQQTKKEEPNPLILVNRPMPENATVIHFEVCVDCHKHSFCTQHDELKYAQLYHTFQKRVEESIPGTFCIVNYYNQPSIGAFEITHQGKIIYSKKNSGLFPSVEPCVKRIQQFLEDIKNKKNVDGYAKTKEKKQEVPIEKKSKPTFQAYIKMKEQEFARQEAIRQENERKRLEQEEKDRQEAERLEKERQEKEKQEKEEREKKEAEEAQKKKQEEEEAAKKAEEEKQKQAAQEGENKGDEGEKKEGEGEQNKEGEKNEQGEKKEGEQKDAEKKEQGEKKQG